MKVVLIVIARFEFGGIPTQAFLWAKFLKRNGYEPIILAPAIKDNRYCSMLEQNGISYDILRHKQGNMFSYLRSLVHSLNSYKPYAILPFNKILAYNINLIWKFTVAEKCFFLERNNGEDTPTTWAGNLMRKAALWNASALLYNSDSASYTSRYPRKTVVIKNAFSDSGTVKENGLPDEVKRIPEDAMVLLHIANIASRKNYTLLLNNWGELKRRFPNAYLVVAGIEVREKLPVIMGQLNQPGIIYLGSQSDVMPLIKRANICLLATFNEGCPNVVLEYMFHHKVVSASDVPELREVLSEENYPLLFQNNSAEDFLDKMEKAINLDTRSADKIIEANHKKLMSDYSERNYNKIIELLAS
jgi:glycosyltransferase involved in cell wall biosynthesis